MNDGTKCPKCGKTELKPKKMLNGDIIWLCKNIRCQHSWREELKQE